jgi:hypothetical protein
MNLTKSKLKQIIKEELRNVLHEQLAPKEHKVWQKKQGQQKKAKATLAGALTNFMKSLSGMRHEAMSGEWLQSLIKVAKNSLRKGDYEQALKDIAKAAVYQKIPKAEIFSSALAAIQGLDIQGPVASSKPALTPTSLTFN